MLGRKTYSKAEISAARSKIEADLKAYRSLPEAARNAALEIAFFNNQVLLLDYTFVHRLSGVEGKDGNPLNEVRVLANSIILNKGKVQIEKLPAWPTAAVSSLTMPVEKSVLKLKNGDAIKVTEADFVKLSKAFFAELEKKYGES